MTGQPASRVTQRRLRGALLDALAAHDEPTALRLLGTLDPGARFDLAAAAQRLAELAAPAVAAPSTGHRFGPRTKRQRWTPRRAATAAVLVGAGASWLMVLGYLPALLAAILFTIAPFAAPKIRQALAGKIGRTTVGGGTPGPARAAR